MKRFIFILLFLCCTLCPGAQNNDSTSTYISEFKQQLSSAKNDTTRLDLLNELFVAYLFSYPDSAAIYIQQEIVLAKQMQSDVRLAMVYGDYSVFFEMIGDYPKALYFIQEDLKLAEKSKNWLLIADSYNQVAKINADRGDYETAILYHLKAKTFMEDHWPALKKFYPLPRQIGEHVIWAYLFILLAAAQTYEKFDHPDSALKYAQMCDYAVTTLTGEKMASAPVLSEFGNIYSKKNDYSTALKYYHSGLAVATAEGVNTDIMKNCIGMASTFKKMGESDSSVFYANKVIELSKRAYNPLIKLDALNLLAGIYKSKNNTDSTAKYFELIIAANDSLFSQRKNIELQDLAFQEQRREQEQAQEQQQLQNRIKLYSLITALAVFLVVAFLLYRNNRQKQKANIELQQQKEKVESTLTELKSTQAQLIQQEKMASLGELTAGIAHEIQNPLNFVNNFSEVNKELVDELKKELKSGNTKNANSIADDIKDNEEKINHHGKRADAIVKNMLQHSRQSKGIKEPTDINALCDEYLRLSYHGLRAKDKNFNAEIKTDFDASIGKINIVPQDIGRVLLNLFNNAFYAVSEKQKTADENYKPLVTVATKSPSPLEKGWVEVIVSDNGNGIPQNIIDKIFQPFFTTKPTGEGTGLGLSLSYDIIKAHGGEIKVETKEGEASEFIIQLPITA
jgi:two-component system NtrC family sensor kinase